LVAQSAERRARAEPVGGFAVLCGYAVVLTGLAAWRLRRRDA
jgi:hypothetical protein